MNDRTGDDSAPEAGQADRLDVLYMIVTGAGTARRMPGLLKKFCQHFEQTIVVPTENSGRVISSRELAQVDGVTVVESYFDEDILPYPPEGVVLIAPCTFNSLNKLANGVADTLALSIAAEAIGRRTPMVVALSVNPPLYAHPQTEASIHRIESWGVGIMHPVETERWMTLAPDEEIVDAVLDARDRYSRS